MQSKKMSLIETLSSVAIGFIISLAAQMIIFPIFGIEVSFEDNLLIGLFFTVVSIIRGYYVRRFFNWIKIKKENKMELKEMIEVMQRHEYGGELDHITPLHLGAA